MENSIPGGWILIRRNERHKGNPNMRLNIILLCIVILAREYTGVAYCQHADVTATVKIEPQVRQPLDFVRIPIHATHSISHKDIVGSFGRAETRPGLMRLHANGFWDLVGVSTGQTAFAAAGNWFLDGRKIVLLRRYRSGALSRTSSTRTIEITGVHKQGINIAGHETGLTRTRLTKSDIAALDLAGFPTKETEFTPAAPEPGSLTVAGRIGNTIVQYHLREDMTASLTQTHLGKGERRANGRWTQIENGYEIILESRNGDELSRLTVTLLEYGSDYRISGFSSDGRDRSNTNNQLILRRVADEPEPLWDSMFWEPPDGLSDQQLDEFFTLMSGSMAGTYSLRTERNNRDMVIGANKNQGETHPEINAAFPDKTKIITEITTTRGIGRRLDNETMQVVVRTTSVGESPRYGRTVLRYLAAIGGFEMFGQQLDGEYRLAHAIWDPIIRRLTVNSIVPPLSRFREKVTEEWFYEVDESGVVTVQRIIRGNGRVYSHYQGKSHKMSDGSDKEYEALLNAFEDEMTAVNE